MLIENRQNMVPNVFKQDNRLRRWTFSRVWSKEIYTSLEHHFASGHRLYSFLGITKLFLDKLHLWKDDYAFQSPTAGKYKKVIFVQVVESTWNETANKLIITVSQIKVAETASETEDRIGFLVAYTDLGELMRKAIKKGDYLALWGCYNTEYFGISVEGKDIIKLNSRHNASEQISLIQYRHIREFSFPVSENGIILNDVKQGGVDVIFSNHQYKHLDQAYIRLVSSRKLCTLNPSNVVNDDSFDLGIGVPSSSFPIMVPLVNGHSHDSTQSHINLPQVLGVLEKVPIASVSPSNDPPLPDHSTSINILLGPVSESFENEPIASTSTSSTGNGNQDGVCDVQADPPTSLPPPDEMDIDPASSILPTVESEYEHVQNEPTSQLFFEEGGLTQEFEFDVSETTSVNTDS